MIIFSAGVGFVIFEQEIMLIFKFKVEKKSLKSFVNAFLLTGVVILIGGTSVYELKQAWSLHSAS